VTPQDQEECRPRRGKAPSGRAGAHQCLRSTSAFSRLPLNAVDAGAKDVAESGMRLMAQIARTPVTRFCTARSAHAGALVRSQLESSGAHADLEIVSATRIRVVESESTQVAPSRNRRPAWTQETGRPPGNLAACPCPDESSSHARREIRVTATAVRRAVKRGRQRPAMLW
jgi:hypothetical protein